MNLSTRYLGLSLDNPLVASSSPLSQELDGIKRLEDAGAGAVVMFSLFEEQIKLESRKLNHHLEYFTDAYAESLTFFPDLGQYSIGPETYLEKIRKAKEAVSMPIIASLNGITTGGWMDYAAEMEEAGADALELNIYYLPTSLEANGTTVEALYLHILKAVKSLVSIPVSVKLNPYFSSIGNMARMLVKEGADGLVLFNRFYLSDIDIDELSVINTLQLSSSQEMLLPLRWVALLSDRIKTDFAISTGVHTYEDVAKGLLAGAKVTMMASELLANGMGRIGEIKTQLTNWMVQQGFESVEQLQGAMTWGKVEDPELYTRANYMKTLASWSPDPAGQGFRK